MIRRYLTLPIGVVPGTDKAQRVPCHVCAGARDCLLCGSRGELVRVLVEQPARHVPRSEGDP